MKKKWYEKMKKWYEGSKEPGVNWLCQIFRVEVADFFREADKYRRHESRATKKGHIHRHRPSGSKAMKKYNRYAWDKMVNRETV